MTRILREPHRVGRFDPRLIGLGLLIGLTAWTRNEAVWLGLTWVVVLWLVGRERTLGGRDRLRLIGVVAVVAIVVYVPWAVRDWIEFGTPLPGQAIANALSVNGTDIFAWNDPPTISRYLAVGPQRLITMRVDGTLHNLVSVLLLLGIPVSAIGLVALPWFGRGRALRPLVVFSVLTFAITSLVFPVSTTWGTFLHAAGPIHVLLIVVCLIALDSVIDRVGVIRGWSRPVAWLGATLTIAGCVLFSAVLLPSFGAGSRETQTYYAALAGAMGVAGLAPRESDPIITDFPIWLADTTGATALALPEEPPTDVLDLARRFGATTVVVSGGSDEGRLWPGIVAADSSGVGCFQEIHLPTSDSSASAALAETRVYRIACP
jgi:hypothetical protein